MDSSFEYYITIIEINKQKKTVNKNRQKSDFCLLAKKKNQWQFSSDVMRE